jgi:TonB family protein
MKNRGQQVGWWSVVVHALATTLVLCSVPVIAEDAPSSPAQPQKPPKSEIINQNLAFYPAKAQRLGQEGRVVMAFDIRADGRVANAVVVSSEEPGLDAAALDVLKNRKFEVPAGGASEGRPYRLGVAFCLRPSSQPTDFEEGVERTVITRSRIPGAPVKNPWKEGASKVCS